MDRIVIRDLRVRCIIGAREHERTVPQDVLVSAVLSIDLRRPGRSDRLEDTLDYGVLVQRIVDIVGRSRFFLLEALAQAVADVCLQEQSVARVRIRIRKPAAARRARGVWVEITRGKRGDRAPGR